MLAGRARADVGAGAPTSLAALSARVLTALAVITVSLPGVPSMTVLLETLRPSVSSLSKRSKAIRATSAPTMAITVRAPMVTEEVDTLPSACRAAL